MVAVYGTVHEINRSFSYALFTEYRADKICKNFLFICILQ